MPLYDYACTKCGQTVEVRHGFNESHGEPCAACGAPMRRVFNAAPVLFKGSGFYVTDSRRSSGGEKAEKKAESGPAAAPAKSDATPSSSPPPAGPKASGSAA